MYIIQPTKQDGDNDITVCDECECEQYSIYLVHDHSNKEWIADCCNKDMANKIVEALEQ